MAVKGYDGSDATGGLRLADHEKLAGALLLARAHLAETAATVRHAGQLRVLRPVSQTLKVAIRQIDAAREQLAAALAWEHPVTHPATSRRVYFPLVGQEDP